MFTTKLLVKAYFFYNKKAQFYNMYNMSVYTTF